MEKEDKVLRAQIEAELRNKTQCSYESYDCSHFVVDGSKYCLKHILKDKSAPYKQCSFVYQNNGKKCHLPAPKGEKKEYGYCTEHSLKATLSRNKVNAKNPSPVTAESLLSNLTHYIRKPKNKNAGYIPEDENRINSEESGDAKAIKVDPFVDIDALTVYSNQCNEVLDMCSESESDVEPSSYGTVWHDGNADSSDDESIDSEDEDPLKHANAFSAEEVSLLTKEKLTRLQSLYIEQYKHLQYLLRERRRKYIHSLKREKETCCNIYNQVKDNPKEQRLYKKLKYYNKYHKTFGEDAILEKKLYALRTKASDGSSGKSISSRCQFSEGGVKCAEKSLPMAKHCRKHILEDSNQVLFKACGKANGDISCNTPVEALFDDSTCKLHMDIPLIRSYTLPRKESESEADETLDLSPHYTMPTNDNVKPELIDYSLPSIPKMETLPTILFEDSVESLSPTLHYSTSEFAAFTEENSAKALETSVEDTEINVTSEIDNDEVKEDIDIDDADVKANMATEEIQLLKTETGVQCQEKGEAKMSELEFATKESESSISTEIKDEETSNEAKPLIMNVDTEEITKTEVKMDVIN